MPWVLVAVLKYQISFRIGVGKMQFIRFCPQHIFVHVILDLSFHFGAERFYDFCGSAENEGIRGDDHALGDHGVGADDAIFSDLGVV